MADNEDTSKAARPTFEQRTEMEYAKGRETAAANAAKFEKAEAERKAEADEARRLADPEGHATDQAAADEAAAAAKPLASGSGVFPHAAEPVQPTPPPTKPTE